MCEELVHSYLNVNFLAFVPIFVFFICNLHFSFPVGGMNSSASGSFSDRHFFRNLFLWLKWKCTAGDKLKLVNLFVFTAIRMDHFVCLNPEEEAHRTSLSFTFTEYVLAEVPLYCNTVEDLLPSSFVLQFKAIFIFVCCTLMYNNFTLTFRPTFHYTE